MGKKLDAFVDSYTKFETRSGRGKQIISEISEWVSIEKTALYTGFLTLVLPKFGVEVNSYWILAGTIVFQLMRKAFLYYMGHFDELKLGIWKRQNTYVSENESMAPFNHKVKETLKVICEKLEIEHQFK